MHTACLQVIVKALKLYAGILQGQLLSTVARQEDLRTVSGLLQVKMLEGGGFSHESVAEFLNKAVEPPPEISVANAVRLLQDIGAFEVVHCTN